MTAEVPVTFDRYTPRAMITAPAANVLADFAVVGAETFPAESTASTE